MKRSCSELLIPYDDWLHRLRRDVVIRREFESESVNAEAEGFRDLLFVGTALVAATRKPNQTTENSG